MPQKTCYETYQESRAKRAENPLPFGHYKLTECRDRLENTAQELDRIKELVSGQGDRWSLKHCVSWDKYRWIKEVPNAVAWRLGYEVLPGLAALTGDGVSQAKINACYPTLKRDVIALLPRLEIARQAITKNIGYEYRLMRLGTPMLRPLVEEAIGLTERALGA